MRQYFKHLGTEVSANQTSAQTNGVQWLWSENRLFFQDASFFRKYFFSIWNTKECFVFNSLL